MILLTSTSDVLRVITGSAGSVKVHASQVVKTVASGAVVEGRKNTVITTATTSTVTNAVAAGEVATVQHLCARNDHASTANLLTLEHFDGTNGIPLWKGQLEAGESVTINEDGSIDVRSSSGVIKQSSAGNIVFNNSTVSQGPGFAVDTYLDGGRILIPGQRPKIGSYFKCRWVASKTAAGTAALTVIPRFGTNGTIADTTQGTLTLSAASAATDVGVFELLGVYRSIGAAAVIQWYLSLISQATTGFSTLLKAATMTGAAHNSDTANTYLGVSFNCGTAAVVTVPLVQAEMGNI